MEQPATPRRSHGSALASMTAVLALLVAALAILVSTFATSGPNDFGAIATSHAAMAPASARASRPEQKIAPVESHWAPDRSAEGASPNEAH